VSVVDAAIIGGGAAGIAAARHLAGLHRSVLLVEALPQLGGRARTATLHGLPLDLGCGWLHSARRNPLAMLAEAQGLALDRSESAWHRQLRNLHFPPSEQREAWTAFRQLGERLRNDPPPSDCAADAMASSDKWRPFVDGVSSFVNGTELNRLSAADYVAYDDAATDDNWRLPSGYGAFIVGLAAGLPTALDTNVHTVSQGADIALETNCGTLHARAAIVAVSSAVLAKNGIRFSPSVDDHLQAASYLPLGVADKIYLSIGDTSAVPPESHLLGRIDRAYLRPFGRPVIECYLGGAWAQALEDVGSQAAFAFAIAELRELLGDSFARRLTPIAATRWARETTIHGSYSHALPGRAGARAVLARPVNERLCFAGEACSEQDYSTAHGAWQSGIRAAYWVERFLATESTPSK
jgi:monoamine oxidase